MMSLHRKVSSTNNSVLVEYFGGNPLVKILDFLIENKMYDYSKKQIATEVGLSKVTFLKYFKKLEQLGLVTVTRRFGKTKLYTLNEKNPLVKSFIKITLDIANYHVPKKIEKAIKVRH